MRTGYMIRQEYLDMQRRHDRSKKRSHALSRKLDTLSPPLLPKYSNCSSDDLDDLADQDIEVYNWLDSTYTAERARLQRLLERRYTINAAYYHRVAAARAAWREYESNLRDAEIIDFQI